MLSCGRPEYVRRTLAAYAAFLTPAPSAVYVFDDGGQTPLDTFDAWPGVPVKVESSQERVGRCAAHANLWRAAAASDFDWVWTVEDDILLLRPLDLRDLADLLDEEPTLAQVALVRCPWGMEVAHGGYIPMRADQGFAWYERRETLRVASVVHHPADEPWPSWEWIASTTDWTSSPALLSTSLTRKVKWPDEAGCEATLGPAIQALCPDAVSGYWGWGEPWVAHIGMERVEGAHGY